MRRIQKKNHMYDHNNMNLKKKWVGMELYSVTTYIVQPFVRLFIHSDLKQNHIYKMLLYLLVVYE